MHANAFPRTFTVFINIVTVFTADRLTVDRV